MREYELREEIRDLAKIIAENDSNPSTWFTWIKFFLQELQEHAMGTNPLYQQLYEDMLRNLQDAIRNRMKTGGW